MELVLTDGDDFIVREASFRECDAPISGDDLVTVRNRCAIRDVSSLFGVK